MSILRIISCASTVRLFFRIPSSHFLSPPTVLNTYPLLLLLLSFLSVQSNVLLPHLARAQATVGPSSSLPPSFPPFPPSAQNDRSPSRLPLSGRLAPPPTDPLRWGGEGGGRQDRPTWSLGNTTGRGDIRQLVLPLPRLIIGLYGKPGWLGECRV